MADQNFRVKHGISIDTNRLVDVNRNINAGVTTFAHTTVTGITTVGIISATNGAGGMGIVTFQSQVAIESGAQRITIAPPSQNAGFVSSYNLTLPAKAGTDGQVLTYGPNGVLGFNTNGLYENRYYVSSANGSDSFDGRSKPFATIKKAAQAASFRSFQLPGGRYLDAGNLLALNKEFIKQEVVGFITAVYPGLIGDPQFGDGTKCRRDTGYIVDAIVYDLSYGGNSKSIEAGNAYWNAGTSYVVGETQETIAAYNYVKTLARYVVNNVAISTSYQTPTFATSQSYDLTIAYDATCGTGVSYSADCCADVLSAIGSYVGIITTIIGIGTTGAPAITLPSTLSKPIAIIVEAGEYVEDNPILLYEDVAVLGDNLRNTIVRPQNAGKDLFRVRNGCYATNFAMKDYVDPAGVPSYTFDNAIAFDDPADSLTSRTGYAVKTSQPRITRSPYIQNCSILSFLGANGILVDGSKVTTPNVAIVPEEGENPVAGAQPEFGKSMVAAAFTMVSFGGVGWRVINDGYSQVVSCFQIFCKYGSFAQSGGYLSITNSATNFGLFALRSTGFSQNSFAFDRGRIAATGTSGGLQTLRVVGLGRSDQDLYVTRFFNNALSDLTSNFKPVVTQATVNPATGINTTTDRVTIAGHPFQQGDTILYLGDENATPKVVIEGLVSGTQYYLNYIDANNFTLYEDDSLTRLVDLKSKPTGINTFQKGNVEFFASEIIDSHNSYQVIGLGTTGGTAQFVSGRQITQTVTGGTAVGYAVTYNSTTRQLLVSVESSGGVRRFFGVSGALNGQIADHKASPVNFYANSVTGVSTYYTIETKIDSSPSGTVISGVSSLPETYYCHFHRPSIVNSSGHTWEYSGSGTDYNALPQNGGRTVVASEQVFSLGGRVYSSGTNELGDFKVGNFITAYNRTGNIIFNNKVTIGQIDSLRLSLSGGVAVDEFSTDVDLGDNETGGAKNSRVSTQLAVRTFLNNRLGNVIDKTVSTNAVPSAIVQLNATGQINADLIPPKVVNYYRSNVSGGRTELVDQIPAINVLQGDTVLEPGQGFVLTADVYGQYLTLSDNTRNYKYTNGDSVVSAGVAGGAIGIVTGPTSVGYGTTGLVKGVLLNVSITSGGSGYTNPGVYTCVLDSSTGIGTSARAAITVGGAGTVTAVSVNYGGRYYANGDILTINNDSLLGGRSGGANFTATVGSSSIQTRLYLRLTNNQKFTASTGIPDYIQDGDAVGVGTSLDLYYSKNVNPTDITIGGDIDFINDRIVVGVTTFTNGDPIIYYTNGGNTIDDLVTGNTYFVKRVGISSIELYTTYALSSKIDLNTSGTGTHTIVRAGVNTAESGIIFEKHGFSTGDSVKVSGSAPTGITTGAFYYIGSVTTNSFTLHTIRNDALASVNGTTISAVGLTSSSTGTMTFTRQNVTYNGTVNTSSNITDNYTVLASGVIDAANITSGTISPSRLGSGTANSDTFLRGDSAYEKVVKSVGIATTEPITANGSTSDLAPGGIGINTYYGKVNISLNRVAATLDTYSTLGVAKFKTSTFGITANGEVTIKSSATGDVDAATLGGQAGAYYLNPTNFTASIPISKGGTGLSALPPAGSILQGNGTTYDLVTSPTISGDLTLTGAGYFRAVGAAITHSNVTGFGTVTNLGSVNATISGIATFSGSGNSINQTAGTAALNRLTVAGISTFTGQLNYGTISGTTITNTGTAELVNQTVTGVSTFSGSGNNINCSSGTQVFNRAVFAGITTFLDQVNVGVANYTTATVGGTLTTQNLSVTGLSTVGRLQAGDGVTAASVNVSGATTIGTYLQVGSGLNVTGVATFLNNVRLLDNVILSLGDGNDLSLYHDGLNSYIDDSGTGDLYIRSNALRLQKYTGETTAVFLADGSSTLYYDNVAKFQTAIDGNILSDTSTITNADVSGIATFSGTARSINQTAGTAALNRLTVAGVSTFSGDVQVSGTNLIINGSGNTIQHTNGTAAFNNLTVSGITTVGQLNFTSLGGSAGATLPFITNTNITVSGVSTFSGSGNNIVQSAGTADLNRLTVAGVSTFTGQLNAGTISASNLTGSLNNTLTISAPLTGTSYNNSAAVSIGINATSANTANYVVQRGASGEFTAGAITATGLTLNGGGSTTSAQLTFSGATNNWISFASVGVAAPAFTTRSAGTKVVYYNGLTAASADYAAGIEASTLWYSVPTTSETFKWYGGTTTAATLTGAGVFTATSTISGTRLISTVATGTAPLTVTSTTQVSNLNASFLEGFATATANTASTIVRRDASGNFSAGTITATLSGTASSSNFLNALGNYVWSASTLPTSYSLGIQCSFISSSQGWPQAYGSVMTMNTYSGGGGALQMFVPYSPTYGGTALQVRFGNYDVSSGNSWTAWKTILQSDNYSSYALPLSGGTLSGALTISGNSLTVTNIYNNGWFRNQNSGEGLYNTVTSNHWYSSNGSYWDTSCAGLSAGGIRIRQGYESTIKGYVYFDSAGFGLLDSGGSWSYRTTTTVAEIYKTLYTRAIDVQNYTISNTGPITPYGVGGNSGHTRSSYAYSFGFQETGGWSGTYPDLVIQYHTGVTLAANPGYEGIRFKADYNDDTLIFQVNGSSNYLFKYYWMFTNTTGFYSSSNSAHLYPNTGSSYTQWRIDGSRNSYGGIWDSYSGVAGIMYDSGGNGGVYREATGRWYFYHLVGNNCMGVNTSTTSGSYGMYVSGSIYSTGQVTAASDGRKKKDVETIENALDKVNQLRGVTYKRTDYEEDDVRNGTTEMGVVAQEVEPIVPEVVTYASDVDEYAVSYGSFAGLFIEAIKEQTAIINNLKKEIENLKSKLGE